MKDDENWVRYLRARMPLDFAGSKFAPLVTQNGSKKCTWLILP